MLNHLCFFGVDGDLIIRLFLIFKLQRDRPPVTTRAFVLVCANCFNGNYIVEIDFSHNKYTSVCLKVRAGCYARPYCLREEYEQCNQYNGYDAKLVHAKH